MGPRVRLVFGIVALILALPFVAAAQTVNVTDPNSVYYKNIETAIKFLREHGETESANEIAARLKAGKIYVKSMKPNGETTVLTGTIYIDTSVATNTRTQKLSQTPFDPNNPSDFGNIVALARTGGPGVRCRLYHSGDTALILDLQLLQGQVDLALLPIGDNFTMGPEDAVRAIEYIQPRTVIPMHYDTWDLIAQDTEDFRRMVGERAEVVVLKPGETFEF